MSPSRGGLFALALATAAIVLILSVSGIEQRFASARANSAGRSRWARLAALHQGAAPCRRYLDPDARDAAETSSVAKALIDAGLAPRIESALLLAWSWSREEERAHHHASEREEVTADLLASMSLLDSAWLRALGRQHLDVAVEELSRDEVELRPDLGATLSSEQQAVLRQSWTAHPRAFSEGGLRALLEATYTYTSSAPAAAMRQPADSTIERAKGQNQ